MGGVYRPMRQGTLKLQTKVSLAWRQVSTPIRPEALRLALEQVTGGGTEILLVHSSLSSCGRFTDGPDGVLSVFRSTGLLVNEGNVTDMAKAFLEVTSSGPELEGPVTAELPRNSSHTGKHSE